jgi:hypothetical protein
MRPPEVQMPADNEDALVVQRSRMMACHAIDAGDQDT